MMSNSLEVVECDVGSNLLSKAYSVIRQLRPELSEDAFVQRVTEAMRENRYSLFVLITDDNAVAAIGVRIITDLCWGRNLYVDDLVVDASQRRKGLGKRLMAFAELEAARKQCDFVRLACGLNRTDAHCFYNAIGYKASSYQFVKPCR
jgi:GNAT superfamily N-acetyltransferase